MNFSDAQIRGRIKNLADENQADPRVLMRLFMMERFLERVSVSKYRENIIVKGGVLITSLLGVSLRSTMDIDTTIQNFTLSPEKTKNMVEEISHIDLDDGINFKLKSTADIMSNMEYPGIRFSLDAYLGKMITPIKVDISTGAVITPSAIEYNYNLLLEDRSISILSYNIETVFAEKLQTILSRGILNTRMRDFYDIHILFTTRKKEIDNTILNHAFYATCKHRQSELVIANMQSIYNIIATDKKLASLWISYQRKFPYARSISFDTVLLSLNAVIQLIQSVMHK